MTIVYLLIPLALLLGGTFVGSFIVSAMKGQFDDLETPSYRILIDDEPLNEKSTSDLKKGSRP